MGLKEQLKEIDKIPAQKFKDDYKEARKFAHELVALIGKYFKKIEAVDIIGIMTAAQWEFLNRYDKIHEAQKLKKVLAALKEAA